MPDGDQMSPDVFDLIVIGAGPAGVVLAGGLAEQGHGVVLGAALLQHETPDEFDGYVAAHMPLRGADAAAA